MRFFDNPIVQRTGRALTAALSLTAATYMTGNIVLSTQDNPNLDSYNTLDNAAWFVNIITFVGYFLVATIRANCCESAAEERRALIVNDFSSMP